MKKIKLNLRRLKDNLTSAAMRSRDMELVKDARVALYSGDPVLMMRELNRLKGVFHLDYSPPKL